MPLARVRDLGWFQPNELKCPPPHEQELNILCHYTNFPYLEHYDTCKDCKCRKHHVIYWGDNCGVECVKCLENRNITKYK